MLSRGLTPSPAVQSLGLGDALKNEVKDETDEVRKKRLRESQERSLMGPNGSLASLYLLGSGYGPGAG